MPILISNSSLTRSLEDVFQHRKQVMLLVENGTDNFPTEGDVPAEEAAEEQPGVENETMKFYI